MSKSSKRRLAIAAIKNVADAVIPHATAAESASALNPVLPNSAKSLLQAAAQTAGSPSALSPHHSALPSDPNSKTPLLDSARSSSVLSVLSDPYVLSASPCETPLLAAARTSLIESLAPDPALAAITPDQICIELPALPPKPPSPFTNSTAPTTTHQSPVPPTTPVQDEFADYQAKLRSAMREWSPADPRIKTMLENYATIMQTVTLERLNSTLTTLSEEAWVETNKQIVRLHSVMERTNSRHSREQREIAAQARRDLREKQRKDRQAQKEADSVARNQRTKERDEQRRQREQAKADRAEQSHQLAIRKLELKERNLKLSERENQLEEKLKHNTTSKSAQSPAAQRPPGPPNTWTCG